MEPTLIYTLASISVSFSMVILYFSSVVIIRSYAYKKFKTGDILKSKTDKFKHTILITKKKNNVFEYKICNEIGNLLSNQIYIGKPDNILYHYSKFSKKKSHLRVVK